MHTFDNTPMWMCGECGRLEAITTDVRSYAPITVCQHGDHYVMMTPNEAAAAMTKSLNDWMEKEHLQKVARQEEAREFQDWRFGRA